MTLRHDDYEIDDALARQDFDRVFDWLRTTYWWESGPLTRETVERGARHCALVVGAYLDNEQVAYVRVVSDTIRFAWIADVYVAAAHRDWHDARPRNGVTQLRCRRSACSLCRVTISRASNDWCAVRW